MVNNNPLQELAGDDTLVMSNSVLSIAMLMMSSSRWRSFFEVVNSGLRVNLTELWIKRTISLLLGLGIDPVVLGCCSGCCAVSLDSQMAATLTLCASRKMLSSVGLFPMPLAFHGSMLNALSHMVEVWEGLGSGEGAHGYGGVPQVVQIQSLALR